MAAVDANIAEKTSYQEAAQGHGEELTRMEDFHGVGEEAGVDGCHKKLSSEQGY